MKVASDQLNEKQQVYVAQRLLGRNMKDAALAAGYAPSTAADAGRAIEGSPAVKQRLTELLDKVCPDEFLAGKLRAGLNATKKTRAMWDGKFTDERVDPDYQTQHKFLETAYKLKGQLKGEGDPAPVRIEVLHIGGELTINAGNGENQPGLPQDVVLSTELNYGLDVTPTKDSET